MLLNAAFDDTAHAIRHSELVTRHSTPKREEASSWENSRLMTQTDRNGKYPRILRIRQTVHLFCFVRLGIWNEPLRLSGMKWEDSKTKILCVQRKYSNSLERIFFLTRRHRRCATHKSFICLSCSHVAYSECRQTEFTHKNTKLSQPSASCPTQNKLKIKTFVVWF